MAVEAAPRLEVAAAKNVGGLVEIDIALDVRRDGMRGARRVIGDEQADRDMRAFERFGELHGGIAADGMADDGDRLGIAAVIGDGLSGDRAPSRIALDIGGDAGAIDALRELIHAPIDHADEATEHISAAVNGGRGLFGASSRDDAGRDQGRRDTACGISEDVFGSNHKLLRFGTD